MHSCCFLCTNRFCVYITWLKKWPMCCEHNVFVVWMNPVLLRRSQIVAASVMSETHHIVAQCMITESIAAEHNITSSNKSYRVLPNAKKHAISHKPSCAACCGASVAMTMVIRCASAAVLGANQCTCVCVCVCVHPCSIRLSIPVSPRLTLRMDA